MSELEQSLILFHEAGLRGDRVLFDAVMPFFESQLHDGFDADAFFDRHCRVIKKYSDVFEVRSFGVSIVGVHHKFDHELNLVEFAVLDWRGRFLWRDVALFDDDGRLRPNQSHFDVVDKLCFFCEEGVDNPVIWRSLGLSVFPFRPAKAFVFADCPVLDSQFGQPLGASSAPCSARANLLFRLSGDDYKAGRVLLKVALTTGSLETRRILLRGIDSPYFIDQRPRVSGDCVELSEGLQRPFALRVSLADGRHVTLEQPVFGGHRFGAEVVSCQLTDAFCIDWFWRRGGSAPAAVQVFEDGEVA